MTEIPEIIKIENKSHIAILDTSSISFMQILYAKGLKSEEILKDYDLILIPKWVLAEINDAAGRVNYVHELIEKGYPIFSINEEIYTDLTDNEEVNLYKIVLASTRQIGRIISYLRRYVERQILLIWIAIRNGLINFMMNGRYLIRFYHQEE